MMANILKKGDYVLCPLRPEKQKHALVKGKLRINSKENLLTTRASCLRPSHDMCIYCPNYTFEAVFKVIGTEEDFAWLEDTLRQIGLALDCKIERRGRTYGDCCLEHPDCVLSEYEGTFEDKHVVNRESMKDAYDVIVAKSLDTIHEVIHVKVTKWHGGFRLMIALRLR